MTYTPPPTIPQFPPPAIYQQEAAPSPSLPPSPSKRPPLGVIAPPTPQKEAPRSLIPVDPLIPQELLNEAPRGEIDREVEPLPRPLGERPANIEPIEIAPLTKEDTKETQDTPRIPTEKETQELQKKVIIPRETSETGVPKINTKFAYERGRDMKEPPLGIVLHCTANKETGKDLGLANALFTKNGGGPYKASWNFTVGGNGEIYEGNGLNKISAHVGVKRQDSPLSNKNSYGIEHAGDCIKPLTEEQKRASFELITYLLDQYPKMKYVMGHANASPGRGTPGEVGACPGNYPARELHEYLVANGHEEVRVIIGKYDSAKNNGDIAIIPLGAGLLSLVVFGLGSSSKPTS